MKRLIAILLCALFAFASALAEAPQTTPSPESTDDPIEYVLPPADNPNDESITLEIDGEPIVLPFDASPQYSSIADGLVQASYYAYSDDGNTLYELFIAFPDTAAPGDTITPERCAAVGEESSVVLIISDMPTKSEQYFFSSVMGNIVYPEDSGYSIRIDSIYERSGGVSYAGSLSANLVALDMSTGETESTLAVYETPFAFTIITGESTPEPTPTAKPAAQSDDMRKV